MRKIFFFLVMGIFFLGTTAHAVTIYVDADATSGANDGSSWTDAYTDLQAALAASSSGDEIWVAEGTYYPGTSTSSCFQMKNGVGIYGGFDGSETARSQRDIDANETILSGANKCYHVFYHPSSLSLTATAVLSGFTIKKGHSNAYGGGMYNIRSSPTISYCTFSGNYAYTQGGGMFNDHSSPTLTGCTFISNNAYQYGGGMVNDDSSPTLTGCTFIGNRASVMHGGGMVNRSSSPILTNCTFSGNRAGSYGSGGGIYNGSSSPILTNCILWGDTATSGKEVYNSSSSSTPQFSCCDVEGGIRGLGTDNGGNINADPRFDSDGIHLLGWSPCINKGRNSAASGIAEDIDGENRLNGTVDMGADEFLDSDEDGLSDYAEEIFYGTDPDDTDSDGDGYDEMVEMVHGTDPADENDMPSAGTIYVDVDFTGKEVGTSWKNALTDLQTALTYSLSGDEIWVAAGTYYPGSSRSSYLQIRTCLLTQEV